MTEEEKGKRQIHKEFADQFRSSEMGRFFLDIIRSDMAAIESLLIGKRFSDLGEIGLQQGIYQGLNTLVQILDEIDKRYEKLLKEET